MNCIYGRVYCRGMLIEAGIEFDNGVITRIGKSLKGRSVRGVILPSAIDVHVHFRDFEEKHKETIESGSLSAMHGGVCLVVDQPNCKPVVDSAEVYFRRMEKAKKLYCDYSLNLALTRNNFTRIAEIVRKIREKHYLPAVGEVFLQHPNPDLQVDYSILKRVCGSVRTTVHAEDAELVRCNSIPNFECRPEEAEVRAVEKCISCSCHFCHISTEKALDLISNSSSTCEVTPHHLLLSEKDYERLGEFVNVNPPLRKKPLLERLNDFDVIASDHAPHTPEEKKEGLPGFPGVETMYPILVSLIKDGLIGLGAIDKLTSTPARIFGFDRFGYGSIEVGKLANFAVFDLSKETKVSARSLHSLCGWTPYEGFKVIFPSEVWLRGERVLPEVAENGRIM